MKILRIDNCFQCSHSDEYHVAPAGKFNGYEAWCDKEDRKLDDDLLCKSIPSWCTLEDAPEEKPRQTAKEIIESYPKGSQERKSMELFWALGSRMKNLIKIMPNEDAPCGFEERKATPTAMSTYDDRNKYA